MNDLLTGKFAELNCITKKTLRLYHETGLLQPHRVDEETGYRFYSYDQCSTVDMIQQLQSLGISLAEIKELLDDDSASLVHTLLLANSLLLSRRIVYISCTRLVLAYD